MAIITPSMRDKAPTYQQYLWVRTFINMYGDVLSQDQLSKLANATLIGDRADLALLIGKCMEWEVQHINNKETSQ